MELILLVGIVVLFIICASIPFGKSDKLLHGLIGLFFIIMSGLFIFNFIKQLESGLRRISG